MSDRYEEIISGERLIRAAPGQRHEAICQRLHQHLTLGLQNSTHARLLSPRSIVKVSAGSFFRPDLALVTTTRQLWLAVEIIDTGDHHTDTVTKKLIYEEVNVPRLWMIDPRYDNVEVYHSGDYGLALKEILAGQDILGDALLPELHLTVAELFRDE